jgi:hypothetical protein
VRPEREGRARRAEHGAHEQALGLGQLGQRHRGRRVTGHGEGAAPCVEDQVGGAGLQHASRALPGNLDQLLRGLLDRRPALLQAA